MGTLLRELVTLLHPHYFVNIILSCIFFLSKTTSPFCQVLYADCTLEIREWELLMFLGCIVVVKNRKQPSYKVYIATICMFAKVLSVVLFMRHNPILGVVYILLCILHLAFLPEPAYKGPDSITYFRGPNLEDEIKRDTRVTWLIEFYAAWSPSCVSFASIFSSLSNKYGLENLKFGKLDASRYGEVAKRFNINASSWSKQLPTLVLFRGGKEVRRRPEVSTGGTVRKFVFSEENIVAAFDLNDLLLQCKKNPIKKKSKKQFEKLEANNDHLKSE